MRLKEGSTFDCLWAEIPSVSLKSWSVRAGLTWVQLAWTSPKQSLTPRPFWTMLVTRGATSCVLCESRQACGARWARSNKQHCGQGGHRLRKQHGTSLLITQSLSPIAAKLCAAGTLRYTTLRALLCVRDDGRVGCRGEMGRNRSRWRQEYYGFAKR